MIADPSAARAAADLEEVGFLSGRDAGRWRIIAHAFPNLDFAISAIEPDGKASEDRLPRRAFELPRGPSDGPDLGPHTE